MSDINYSEIIFDSVDQIVTERLKQIQFDRTLTCEIIQANHDKNEYLVQYENLKLKVFSADSEKKYKEKDMVYVLVPNGDYEQTKLIIGSYNSKNTEKKSFITSYDDLIINDTIPLVSSSTRLLEYQANSYVPSQSEKIEFSPLPYDKPYDYIGLHWNIDTYELSKVKVNTGKYHIQLLLFDNVEATIPITILDISSDDIYGNPYALTEAFEQYSLFKYTEVMQNVTHIQLQLTQIENEEAFNISTENQPLITLSKAEISLGYSLNKFQPSIELFLTEGQNIEYEYNASDETRTLYLHWNVEFDEKSSQILNYRNPINNSNDNIQIYWLHYEEGSGRHRDFPETIKDVVNWNVLEKGNNFFKEFSLKTIYSTDQYKVLIIETNDHNEIVQTWMSNAIVFKNTSPGIQIVPGITNDGLKLSFNNGDTGIYNVYGLDGNIVDYSKQGPYSITASFLDAIDENSIKEIKWTFPQTNTMVNYIEPEDGQVTLTATYKIKTKYYQSATNNVIQCDVSLITGETRTATANLWFGEFGNQGSNYALNIDFIDSNFLGPNNRTTTVKATLSNSSGDIIQLSDMDDKIKWSWVFPSDINVEADTFSCNNIKYSLQDQKDTATLIYEGNLVPNNNYSILQVIVSGITLDTTNSTIDLVAYLPIPITIYKTEDNPNMAGAARIVYDSLGTGATYSTENYKLYVNGIEEDNISWQLTSVSGVGLPQLRNINDKYTIVPSSYAPDAIPKIAISAQDNGNTIWSQPILILQNLWISETVNDWNGTIQIPNNGDKGSILAPLLIAGQKEEGNTFTGVMIGQIGNADINQTGIYGFSKGSAQFWIAEDGILHAKGAIFDNNTCFGNETIGSKFSAVAGSISAEVERAQGAEEKLASSISTTAEQIQTTLTQQINGLKEEYNSKFTQTATAIDAKVSSLYNNTEQTFGWKLTDDEFSVYSGQDNNKVLSVIEEGLSVRGKIEATELILGEGVTISSKYITGLDEGFVTPEDLEDANFIKASEILITTETDKNTGLITQNIAIGGKEYKSIYGENFLFTNVGLGTNNDPEDGTESYFIVDRDGLLTAKNAVIYGTIYATNGYFGGELQAATGTFKGSLNVEADEFKVRIGEEGLYAGTNNEYISLNKDKKLKIKTNEFHFTLGEEQPDYVEVNFDEEWYFLNWENYYIKDNNGNYIPNTSEEQDYDIIYYKKGQKFPTTNGLYCMRDGKNIFSVSEEGEINFGPKNSGFYYNETSGTVFNGWFTKYFGDSATEEEKADRCWFDGFYLESLNTPFDGLLGNGLKIYSYAYYNDLHPTAETDFFIGGGSYFKEDDYTDMWYTAAGIIYSNKNMYIYTEDEGYLYGTWWLNAEKVVQSDRNLKHDIENLLSNYETFFDNLMPVRYKYNNGTSNRYHIGLIAQDVEKAIEASGLTSQECAILVKDKQENYGLRYGELIALNTWQIQKLKTRVIELENEIKEIKKHYEI